MRRNFKLLVSLSLFVAAFAGNLYAQATPALTFGGKQLKGPSAVGSTNGLPLLVNTNGTTSVGVYDTQRSVYSVPIPTAMTWDLEGCTFSLYDDGNANPIATCSKTGSQLFAMYSTALSAPNATIYVAGSGNDSTGNGSSGSPYATINKAIAIANAGGQPAKIIVAGGTYQRFTESNPTVDIALIANGRVNTGAFDVAAMVSFTSDATYTNTYSATRSNVDRVVDITQVDSDGHWVELLGVTSEAICNRTPNSWYMNGSNKLFINRADGAQPTSSNTRYYLTSAGWISIANNINFYMGGVDATSGFDVEGGQFGCIRSSFGSGPVNRKIFVAENSTFRYAGGKISTAAKGVALETWYGSAWFFSCDASHNITDGFNGHNTNGATFTAMVTVNCTGIRNGEGPSAQQSCNGWTTHENVQGIDLCGVYERNNGGQCRSINTSISLLAGTQSRYDRGDKARGGSVYPTAYEADDTAQYYLYRARAIGYSGTRGYFAGGTGTISLRDCYSNRLLNGGTGTLNTWTAP